MPTILCFGCMKEINRPNEICPHCGYDNHIRENGRGLLRSKRIGGRYLVGRMLGRGGFGATYIGYDINRKCRVAIKEYFPNKLVTRNNDGTDLNVYPDCEKRYQDGLKKAKREAKLAQEAGFIRGIVQVNETVEENNTLYIIMEYVEGETLYNYISGLSRRPTVKEALKLLEPIAFALDTLHSNNIVHRDVKPLNIMVRKENHETVLLDFGSAKETDADDTTTYAVVSPGYAPQEQYSVKAPDGRMDQYALAATLYFVLTGQKPEEAFMRMVKDHQISIRNRNPEVSEAVERVINKGMAIYAEDRYPSISAFWYELYAKVKNENENIPIDPQEERRKKEEERRRIEEQRRKEEERRRIEERRRKEEDRRKIEEQRRKEEERRRIEERRRKEEDRRRIEEQRRKEKERRKKTGGGNEKAAVALLILAAMLILVFVALNSVCNHQWSPASCTEASRCVKCGKEQGSPLMHYWQDNVCLRCGETVLETTDNLSPVEPVNWK